MLKQRVLTALVLVGLLLPALFASSPWPFAVFALAGFAAAGWEWARLNGAQGFAPVIGLLLAAACVAALAVGWVNEAPAQAWWLATAAWILGGILALRLGPAGWPSLPRPIRWALGIVLLWTAWLAIVHARSIGINFILSIFSLVWAADTAAYFGGRALGRRKLAPSISPGKSWEGVWSGMLGGLIVAVLWLAGERLLGVDSQSLYRVLLERLGIVGVVFGVTFLAAMSVVGDLFESLVKRSAGAKDSSSLLPGHGGVLDRIDALLPVFPIALALVSF